jgi:two-component system, OmpR family, sensor histidine kinase MprB
MTLRARLAGLTAVAVALAIVVASVTLWLLIRSSLLAEVDQRLLDAVSNIERITEMTVALPDGETVGGDFRVALQRDPIGVQLLEEDGRVARQLGPADDDLDLALADAEELLFEPGAEQPHLRTVTIDGTNYRVMAAPVPDEDLVLRLLQPLDGVETTMTRIAWLLAVVAGGGIAAAGGLGWATARAGLRPVDRLVEAAEQVAATKDLAHRIDVERDRRDEINRLAGSVNAMLAALDEARTQQRELVENAGHELRTPLAILRNDLGLLLRAEQHPERDLDVADRAALLRDLETEAEVLSELVAEVLDLARGELEPEPPVETDLAALVERAITRTRRVNPTVTIEVRGEGRELLVRPLALERAVANLVRNAVQVSDDGGRVEVELRETDGSVVVQVLDRGPGISDEDLPRIFDRFYRGASARERPGSGLGLAIVAQVAALHGGGVDAANRPGGGARFTLRLPAAPVAWFSPTS